MSGSTDYVPLDNLAETKRNKGGVTAQSSPVIVCLLLIVLIATVGGLFGYMYENPLPVTYHNRQYRVEWSQPLTGRVFLIFSNMTSPEPRFTIGLTTRDSVTGDHKYYDSQYIFGVDVNNAKYVLFNETEVGFPVDYLGLLPSGRYYVQGLLNVYTTFNRGDGYNITLHMDRGEGQQWNSAPGNIYSAPRWINITEGQRFTIKLDQTIPPIVPPTDTPFVKYVTINSPSLSDFWGTNMTLGAALLLPFGYDTHPDAKYPLVIYHGHFSKEWATPVSFRETPPDPTATGYDLTQQQYAYQLYLDWTNATATSVFYGRRVIIVCIQHANPYYDDSYAVNSENVGPYRQAIEGELIPYLQDNFNIIPDSWARVVYGGSTGGWEALAVQVLSPEFYNGAWVNCPDPVDFHAFELINLYEDTEAFFFPSSRRQTIRPSTRDQNGNIWSSLKEEVRLEYVLGSPKSGGQWDIWQAVYSPINTSSGYPQEIFDRVTGKINRNVANYWTDTWDLTRYLNQSWSEIGFQLTGKLHIKVGTMDNYYLNVGVKKLEDFLSTTGYAGSVEYGNGFDHCYSGSDDRTAISRLTINQRFIPEMTDWIIREAPADQLEWTTY